MATFAWLAVMAAVAAMAGTGTGAAAQPVGRRGEVLTVGGSFKWTANPGSGVPFKTAFAVQWSGSDLAAMEFGPGMVDVSGGPTCMCPSPTTLPSLNSSNATQTLYVGGTFRVLVPTPAPSPPVSAPTPPTRAPTLSTLYTAAVWNGWAAPSWWTLTNPTGTTNYVQACAVTPAGLVTAYSTVQLLNGTNWTVLGTAPPFMGGVNAVLSMPDGRTLMVGGNFNNINGVPGPLASWNGQTWSAVPLTGLPAASRTVDVSVSQLTLVRGGQVVAAVVVNNMSSTVVVTTPYLFLGSSWVPLVTSSPSPFTYITAFAVVSDRLYIAGGPLNATTMPLGLAYWRIGSNSFVTVSGSSASNATVPPPVGVVSALAVYQGALVLGCGNDVDAGFWPNQPGFTPLVSNVLLYDGSSFSLLTPMAGSKLSGRVSSLAAYVTQPADGPGAVTYAPTSAPTNGAFSSSRASAVVQFVVAFVGAVVAVSAW